MNKVTQHQNTLLSHLQLKPLLIAIPIALLAACAHTPENTPESEQAIYEETSTPEPELTSAEDNSITVDGISNTTKGSNPMTVLVIEDPRVLAQLNASESIRRPNKQVFHFGFNQASLSEEDIELIEKHADYLKSKPELNVTIHGHTDTQGNSDYNIKLSEKRALILVNQLKKLGINKNRIKTVGWGGNYPLVNSLNFSENRRIEIEYSETNYASKH